MPCHLIMHPQNTPCSGRTPCCLPWLQVLELPGQENAQHSKGLSGSGRDKDFALVNGGWKPVIPMEVGQWRRRGRRNSEFEFAAGCALRAPPVAVA